MQEPYRKTGGARIGWVNATWPLARLQTTPERLTLTVFILGEYTFTPEQVCAIEPYVVIPVLGWGIRVRHCVPDYPERIVFWSLCSPSGILRGIQDTGFLSTAAGVPADAICSAMPPPSSRSRDDEVSSAVDL